MREGREGGGEVCERGGKGKEDRGEEREGEEMKERG